MAMAANTNIIIILCFFLFIFTQIPTLSAFPTITTTSNETDLQSLLDFKNLIQIDPFHILDSWNHSLHFCDWDGITCGRKHKQRVTVLDVYSLDLVGTLSPSIGNVTFLTEIHLEDNFFHGLIPHEIGSLFRLQILGFSNNSFEGPIPANLSLCKNLLLIHLYGNKLSGRIPDQPGALPNLLQLGLSINNFIGCIPPSLEYGMGGDVSTKGDIYSYGILLLEMFTGKKPTDTTFRGDFTLHKYVKSALDSRVAEIIDPRLLIAVDNEENKSNNSSTRNNVESCCLSIFQVGVSCSSEIQNERMDIKDALIELHHNKNKMH